MYVIDGQHKRKDEREASETKQDSLRDKSNEFTVSVLTLVALVRPMATVSHAAIESGLVAPVRLAK